MCWNAPRAKPGSDPGNSLADDSNLYREPAGRSGDRMGMIEIRGHTDPAFVRCPSVHGRRARFDC